MESNDEEPILRSGERGEDSLQGVFYKREIMSSVFQFGGLFYLVYGVFITYIWVSKELDAKSSNDTIINYFWDPTITTYSICNFTVFVLILLNKYWIYKATEIVFPKKVKLDIVVCFILIPVFLSSAIFKIIALIWEVAIIPCHGYMTFTEPLSTLALLVGAAILIFDTRQYTNCFKDWIKNMIGSNLMFLTMLGLMNCLLISVATEHVLIFIKESENSSYSNRFVFIDNCTQSSNISRSMNRTMHLCNKYLRPTYTLFCISTLAHLTQLLLKKETRHAEIEQLTPQSSAINSNETPYIDGDKVRELEPSQSLGRSQNRVSYRLPSLSLVLCITFLSVSLLNFIIVFSLRQNNDNIEHKVLGSLIFCSLITIVYVLGSVLSVVHIIEIKRWPLLPNRRGSIIDKCLIWIGAGGQVCQSMTSISKSIIFLVSEEYRFLMPELMYMMILSSLMVVTQTLLQTVHIRLFLDRQWIRPEINSWVESLCPAVGMMGLNMGMLMLSLDHLTSPILPPINDKMFVELFASTLTSVGETLCILQRLHATLSFASMIMYTHN